MTARLVAVVLLASALLPVSASAQEVPAETQEYQPPLRPSYKDVYCAGFVSSTRLPTSLTVIAAEDAIGRMTYGQGEFVYLSQGGNGGVQVGQEYLVVRPVRDPTKIQSFRPQNRILGNIGTLYHDVGRVRVHVVHETTATAEIVHTCDPMQNTDILIPFQERPVPDYREAVQFDRFAPFSGGAVATVVAARDFPTLIGTGDAIYINLGTGQGVKVGDYFRIFRYGTGTRYEGAKRGGKARQPGYREQNIGYLPTRRDDLPREALGEAMVVWVDAESATALVTGSVREIHPGDYVELQPPALPVASLVIEPRSIVRGQSAVLSWATGNSTDREISPEIGPVDRRGTRRISPSETTTYRLAASGPGGATEATATLTVVEPPPPPPPPPEPEPLPVQPEVSLDDLFAQNVQDIFFDFDSSNIRPEARAALEQAAQFLNAYADVRVLIEGHCDEIGTPAYNRRLGEHRTAAARDVLVSLGVDPGRISTVSYGKERPFCTESAEEACRQLNRRGHFVRQ
ncbi:MAG: OmpA family protein [Acidobacteria bacterium]|nr:OmpA family protein [Acidobacteriota bacterium]